MGYLMSCQVTIVCECLVTQVTLVRLLLCVDSTLWNVWNVSWIQRILCHKGHRFLSWVMGYLMSSQMTRVCEDLVTLATPKRLLLSMVPLVFRQVTRLLRK